MVNLDGWQSMWTNSVKSKQKLGWQRDAEQVVRGWKYLESILGKDSNLIKKVENYQKTGKRELNAMIPLSGDSPAIDFLYELGFNVTALEYSTEPVQIVSKKFKLKETEEKSKIFTNDDGSLTVIQGDFFKYEAKDKYDLVYDRAAMVAILPKEREQYTNVILKAMKEGAHMYVQHVLRKDESGPPHNLTPKHVQDEFGKDFKNIDEGEVESNDVIPWNWQSSLWQKNTKEKSSL